MTDVQDTVAYWCTLPVFGQLVRLAASSEIPDFAIELVWNELILTCPTREHGDPSELQINYSFPKSVIEAFEADASNGQ